MSYSSSSADPAAHPLDPAAAAAELASRRLSYRAGELTEDGIAGSWLEQLQAWYAVAAAEPRIIEANAMQVATADADGRPDVRTVLARGFDAAVVVFFTNYDSAKGRQLAANPVAAGLFSWLALERQVRFRGPVQPVSRADTVDYFHSRPREAQLGAWASPQSQVLSGRAELEARLAATGQRFGEAPVPPPDHWGGYRITVEEMEFWQGREFRLHDRLRFRRTGDEWALERLAP